LSKRFPEDTIVQFNYLPTLHAHLALRRTNASKAIEALQAAGPYELGNMQGNNPLYSIYVRGEAYLAGLQGSQAAAEFQKILDHLGIVVNQPIGALAHLQIGRAYAMQGDAAKAKAAYQDFLTRCGNTQILTFRSSSLRKRSTRSFITAEVTSNKWLGEPSGCQWMISRNQVSL
jgi:eukaryotic-like serine/threonine-protein kinase